MRGDCLPLTVVTSIDICEAVLTADIDRLLCARIFVLAILDNTAPGYERVVGINHRYLWIEHLPRIQGDRLTFNDAQLIRLSTSRSVGIRHHYVVRNNATHRLHIVVL